MYAVIVHLAPSANEVPLEPARAESVAEVLGGLLGAAREATGADGTRVTVVDRWAGTHPHGASLAIAVEADDPRDALDAVTAYVMHGLRSIPALEGWSITDATVAPPGARAPRQAAATEAGSPGHLRSRREARVDAEGPSPARSDDGSVGFAGGCAGGGTNR